MNLDSLLFTDFAIQFHSGSGISKRERMWHFDCHNSILHMAISVAGNRQLWYKDQNCKILKQCQIPGDIYVASSNVIEHAVTYPTTVESEPIIAIQCRLSLQKEQYDLLAANNNLIVKQTERIAAAATRETFVLPSMEEIATAERDIKNSNATTATRSLCFKCNQCGKEFASAGGLANHMNIHNDRFVCSNCGLKCESGAKLRRHFQTHLNDRKFVCKHCSRSFNVKYNLTEHLKIHTGIRPFQCKTCKKRFLRKYHLTRHNETKTRKRG